MREILFRGKSVLNGEWLFGNFLKTDDGVFVIQNFDPFGGLAKYEVDHNAVCQYTGLTDKNGRKIFEGDVVSAWSEGSHAIGRVKQRIDGLWLLYPAWQNKIMWGLCPNNKGKTTVEIIGNIFDNPELIGEQP